MSRATEERNIEDWVEERSSEYVEGQNDYN